MPASGPVLLGSSSAHEASCSGQHTSKKAEIKKWFHLRCDPFHPMRGEDEEQRLKTRQDELFEPFTHSKKGALPVKDSVLGARSPVPSSSGYFNDSELHFQGAVELTMIFS